MNADVEELLKDDRIDMIHIRNITAPMPRFEETFIDNGFYDYYPVFKLLAKYDYKGFVNGYAYAENLPEDFRSQLVDATAQFAEALAPRHASNASGAARDGVRSLMSVKAISDSLGTDSTAYVKLQLNFSDSTTEQIELPLVLMEEGWKMK